MSRYTKAEQDEAKAFLLANAPAGSTVYLSLQSVSRSGMSRVIVPAIKGKDGDFLNVAWYLARVCGLPFVSGFSRGVRISGCGMDMGLALVDQLSYALYDKPVDQSKKWNPEDATGGLKYQWL